MLENKRGRSVETCKIRLVRITFKLTNIFVIKDPDTIQQKGSDKSRKRLLDEKSNRKRKYNVIEDNIDDNDNSTKLCLEGLKSMKLFLTRLLQYRKTDKAINKDMPTRKRLGSPIFSSKA